MTADIAFWDGLAERYAAKPVEDPAAFERKIAITLAHLTPASVVLDVGCGTGSLALRLAPHAARVFGLDASSEMIRIARGKAQGVDRVELRQGTLSDVELAPASIDVLCAYSLLHLVEDRAATLRRMFALLKPGGVLVSSTACLGDSWAPYGLLLPAMRWFGKAPRVSIFGADTLRREVAEAGFVDLDGPDVGAEATIAFLVARRPA